MSVVTYLLRELPSCWRAACQLVCELTDSIYRAILNVTKKVTDKIIDEVIGIVTGKVANKVTGKATGKATDNRHVLKGVIPMKAVVLHRPCKAEELRVEEIPMPQVKPGWVRIKIKAFGLNRAEIVTRNGFSPAVQLPRVIGIECVGIIDDPSDSQFSKGDRVFSIMGGLGRDFDGSYAEYTLVPAEQVYTFPGSWPWEKLAAVPETYFTAYGALTESLRLQADDVLLVRGGTTTVGIAAIQLGAAMGARVLATTRSEDKIELLQRYGAEEVLLDKGILQNEMKERNVTKVLELVGAGSLKDSLAGVRKGGIVCMTGILSGWVVPAFEPLDDIPSGAYVTCFNSTAVARQTMEGMAEFVAAHHIEPVIARIFSLQEIGAAQAFVESNRANGKTVVMTGM